MACPEHGRWVAQDRRAIDDVPPRVGLHCLQDLEIVSILCGEPFELVLVESVCAQVGSGRGVHEPHILARGRFSWDLPYSTAGAVVLCCALPLGRHTQPQRERWAAAIRPSLR